MFTTFGSRLARGSRRNARATVTISSAKKSDQIFTEDKAEKLNRITRELQADTEVLRQEYEKLQPVSVPDFIKKHSEAYLSNYEKLHKALTESNVPFRSPFSASFEAEASPEVKEGIQKWWEVERHLVEVFSLLHGENFEVGSHRMYAFNQREFAPTNEPVKVCVTGASGQLGYALIFRIASGAMFGPNTPVILSLLELPQAMGSLGGVVMELRDCAFPLIKDIVASDDPYVAFSNVDYALLVGARPRSKGMERGDLLKANAEIFSNQGKALNAVAKADRTRILVVGNPANTNAMIASHHAPLIPPQNFSAMTRLDHNRGLAQLATKFNCNVDDIERFVIWGNHSATQYPDITHTKVKGAWATDLLKDKEWLTSHFYPTVQKRGAAIIEQRGLSSAASAASAATDAVADWHSGTSGRWTSAAVYSNGEYGVTPGLFYSYPVVYKSGEFDIVRDLPITEASAHLMELTHKELLAERDDVSELLQ